MIKVKITPHNPAEAIERLSPEASKEPGEPFPGRRIQIHLDGFDDHESGDVMRALDEDGGEFSLTLQLIAESDPVTFEMKQSSARFYTGQAPNFGGDASLLIQQSDGSDIIRVAGSVGTSDGSTYQIITAPDGARFVDVKLPGEFLGD
eukprot:CAMPEP_0196805638 /NCGR_PEP_ID=MMETSP1362-20130617/5433_1 /TAXON_ID=163516 /ORGANISM="Leptocylindrus danicus, Strain CCMP1856" /LENGTH=147 /DNA_ID=CAMNT_0042178679 /DNA_START=165 /DNA_END=608 /DNA_ORIENTATION=-